MWIPLRAWNLEIIDEEKKSLTNCLDTRHFALVLFTPKYSCRITLKGDNLQRFCAEMCTVLSVSHIYKKDLMLTKAFEIVRIIWIWEKLCYSKITKNMF